MERTKISDALGIWGAVIKNCLDRKREMSMWQIVGRFNTYLKIFKTLVKIKM